MTNSNTLITDIEDERIKPPISDFYFQEGYIFDLVIQEIERKLDTKLLREHLSIEWIWRIDPTSGEYVLIDGLKLKGYLKI